VSIDDGALGGLRRVSRAKRSCELMAQKPAAFAATKIRFQLLLETALGIATKEA
jgi:hypothetical protein